MHSFDEFVERLNKPNKESYKETKNSQYGNQEARIAYKRLQYKYCEGINYTLSKLGCKQALMKQRKFDYAEHYKKYKLFFNMDKAKKFISYIRYADEFLIGINGSRKYALQVKQDIFNFLQSHLHLNISRFDLVNKNEGKVFFLGHFIKIVSLNVKTKVQNTKNGVVQKAKTRVFNRLKVNDQRLATALFLRTKKKTVEVLNNVFKLYGFKPTSEHSVKVTAIDAAMEHLNTIRKSILLNSFQNSFIPKNSAINRFWKSNDERIQLNEQIASYSIFETIKNIKLFSQDEKSWNTSKEILKELKRFEHTFEKIVKNLETKVIEKKRQSLLAQRKEKRKVSSQSELETSKKIKKSARSVFEGTSRTQVNIKVNADIKTIVHKLRLKGFFHPLKDRPKSNSYLVSFSEKEIIKYYNSVMLGLLNWFSGADNFHAVKGVVQALRKSCVLTLSLKHRYKSQHKVYTVYGFDITTKKTALCSRYLILNKRKESNINNMEKFNWNDSC